MHINRMIRRGLLPLMLFAPLAFAHEPAATTSVHAKVDPNATQAVEVVDAFSRSMQQGDLKAAGALLATDVVILESGGVERSREEYLGHHGSDDAAFLQSAHVQPTGRSARANGDMAWVASDSEVHVVKDGKTATLLSTETMVLQRVRNRWHIVHIHWSSRPKKQ